MKKLLTLLILPLGIHAQKATDIKQAKTNTTAIIVNSGIGFQVHDQPFTNASAQVDLLRHGIGVYRDFENHQIGGLVEFAIDNTGDVGNIEIAPQLQLNRIFEIGKHSLYGGGTVGYKYIDHGALNPGAISKGYLLGLQTGFVFNLSKRFATSLDVGVRSAQMWQTKQGLYEQHINRYFLLYFPVTAGVRYKY